MSETCRVILNQVKQKLYLVGYLLTRYFKDARYHERKKKNKIKNKMLQNVNIEPETWIDMCQDISYGKLTQDVVGVHKVTCDEGGNESREDYIF